MPKIQTITTNFTAGELSPLLAGRVDLDKYGAGAELLQNCVILKTGGVTMAPARDYVGTSVADGQASRLLPFEVSRTARYLLEFSTRKLAIWEAGARVAVLDTPYEADEVQMLDFASEADTMILVCPTRPVYALRHFTNSRWSLGVLAFEQPVVAERGDYVGASCSISATTVGATATVTSGSAATAFLAADVGRTLGWGLGRAEITAVVDATHATVKVTATFDEPTSSAMRLFDSPLAELTIPEGAVLGDSIAITADRATFKAAHADALIDAAGGLFRVQSVTSATVVQAVILVEPQALTAPLYSWALLRPAWNAVDGYPRTVSIFQGRLWFGGTARYPTTVWGSRTGLYFDFQPGTDDEAAVYKTIDTDDGAWIEYLCSAWALLALTSRTEHQVIGGIERPITPANFKPLRASGWGAARARPVDTGDLLVYVQRGGKVLRAMRDGGGEKASNSDIGVWSQHLFDAGIAGMTWQQSPNLTLWVWTRDGKVAIGTVNDEQNLIAFASSAMPGSIESMATVGDDTYACVRYATNSKRYLERVNWGATGMVARRAVDLTSAAAQAGGFGHIEGFQAAVLADGIVQPSVTVQSGVVNMPRPAKRVVAGLLYGARVRLSMPEVGTGSGTAQGQTASTHLTHVRLHMTVGGKVNGHPVEFRRFDQSALDQAVAPVSGWVKAPNWGWAEGESDLLIEQPQPYPWTVLAVVRSITINTG